MECYRFKFCKCVLLLILLQTIVILGINLLSFLRGNNTLIRSLALLETFSTNSTGHVYNASIIYLGNSTTFDRNYLEIVKNYKFKEYKTNKPRKYFIKDNQRKYFISIGKTHMCFLQGTDILKTRQTSNDSQCVCKPYYYGRDCGIPEAAWFGMYYKIYPNTTLRPRSVPRRVINGLPVNHEFAMFEARIHELNDIVDVFLIAESNYTAHGDHKELLFIKRFQEGYMARYQEKIVHVKLDYFSERAKADGWYADSYIRTFMGQKGLSLIEGLRDDDLFVLSDADELPSKEIITFLKVYDGYPEPIGFAMRWNIFNFHWLSSYNMFGTGSYEHLSTVYAVATIGFLEKVLDYDAFHIRKVQAWKEEKLVTRLVEYTKDHWVQEWVAGKPGHYAGWHCSWCFSPQGIVRKLDSAQANDKPRWGDYPSKKDHAYILSLMTQGRWFNDIDTYLAVTNSQERFYAPSYFLENPQEYRSILYHPNHPSNLGKEWKPP